MPTLDDDQSHLDRAHALKEEANKFYAAKNYPQAIRLYHQCLLHTRAVQQLSQFGLQGLARSERDQIPAPDVEDGSSEEKKRNRMNSTSRGEEMKEEAISVTIKCYNNLAACILNGQNRGEKDFLRAVDYCDKVLAIDSTNDKALFRKGTALARATLYDKAIHVLKLCGNNREAQTQIAQCERLMAEDRKKRDEQIRRNFARAQARESARNQEQQNGHGGGEGGNCNSTMNGCCQGPSTSGVN